MRLVIDYCGEVYKPGTDRPFTIGRDADLVIDSDNAFLHRHFLRIDYRGDLWWLSNIGTALMASVSANLGLIQAWLVPAAHIPLVFGHTAVLFTAGNTTYEFFMEQPVSFYESVTVQSASDLASTTTTGLPDIDLTPSQRLLIVALAENVLAHAGVGGGTVPDSREAAFRLGWTLTKFNRKLDNVCDKLTRLGIRGLHGERGKVALSRKARLVEYAIGARLVTVDDVGLLDLVQTRDEETYREEREEWE